MRLSSLKCKKLYYTKTFPGNLQPAQGLPFKRYAMAVCIDLWIDNKILIQLQKYNSTKNDILKITKPFLPESSNHPYLSQCHREERLLITYLSIVH